MLRDVAWRQVMDSWKEEARSHSKLVEVQKLIEKGYCMLLVIASDMVNRMPIPDLIECIASDYAESRSRM